MNKTCINYAIIHKIPSATQFCDKIPSATQFCDVMK